MKGIVLTVGEVPKRRLSALTGTVAIGLTSVLSGVEPSYCASAASMPPLFLVSSSGNIAD